MRRVAVIGLAIIGAGFLWAQNRVIPNPFGPGSGLEYIPTPASGPGSGTVTSVTIAPGTGITTSGTCTITSTGTCTVTNNTTLAPVVPGSPDILDCSSTANITTQPVKFASTWTMPPFTQTAGAFYLLHYPIAIESLASIPGITEVVYLDSTTPLYASSVITQAGTTTGGVLSANNLVITANTIGASGTVTASTTSTLGATSVLSLNNAVSPVFLNGAFTSNPGPWTLGAGWTIVGGAAVATAATNTVVTQLVPVAPGEVVNITYTLGGYTSGAFTGFVAPSGGTLRTSNGTYTDTFTLPQTTTSRVVMGFGTNGASTGTISNVSITSTNVGVPVDTTVGHTISVALYCSSNTAFNTFTLKGIFPSRGY